MYQPERTASGSEALMEPPQDKPAGRDPETIPGAHAQPNPAAATDVSGSKEQMPPAQSGREQAQAGAKPAMAKWSESLRTTGHKAWRASEDATRRWKYKFDKSTFRQKIVDSYQNRTPRGTAIAIGLLLLLLIVVFLLFRSHRNRTTPLDPEQQVVSDWLDAQKAGHSGDAYVASRPDSVRLRFYAMTDWRIVARPRPGEFIVEVGSAAPSGAIVSGRCRVIVATTNDRSSSQSELKVVQVELLPPSAPWRY